MVSRKLLSVTFIRTLLVLFFVVPQRLAAWTVGTLKAVKMHIPVCWIMAPYSLSLLYVCEPVSIKLFISCHCFVWVSCDVLPHENHLITIHRGHNTFDLLILSSILCVLADLFSVSAFDTIWIRFIVEICFGIVGGGGHCLQHILRSCLKSIKNCSGVCDALYMKIYICWIC
jgi:hypothetical protein